MITFGWVPLEFTVALARGSDFVFTLIADPTWPAGIAIELRLSVTGPGENPSPTVWPATISGSNASWDVPAAAVGAVIDTGVRFARLRYREPDGSALVWMKGGVRIAV